MNNEELKEIIDYSKNLNVLFIEDNQEVREQITKLLINFFPNVVSAKDGQEGYNLYKDYIEKNETYYDLVISDLNLPKLDGINLCKEILKENPKQIILVISAHTETDKLQKLIDIGIYKFLQKPVDYLSFLNAVKDIIGKIKDTKN